MLESSGKNILSLKDIRNLYDIILKNAILKKDLPNGKYFRKEMVYITDGINQIHFGIEGEDNINKNMQDFIDLYNSKLDTITKMILCHFIFENTHPFYDGNGRLGRYLFFKWNIFRNKKLFFFCNFFLF